MLDRTVVLKELQGRLARVQCTTDTERERALAVWNQIAQVGDYNDVVPRMGAYAGVPHWFGSLAAQYALERQQNYRVVAVDGSQLYPDRHQGIDCYLINLGIVDITYGEKSRCVLRSEPSLCLGSEAATIEYQPELVNTQRTEYELKAGLACLRQAGGASPALFLIDGSLIFWHLTEPRTDADRAFVERYHAVLEDFFDRRALVAGYISMPKSRDLISILRYAAGEPFEHLVDADILMSVLAPGYRTTIFESCVAGVQGYATHTKPHFFYCNTGEEIARVELPAWVARDPMQVDLIARCIFDQSIKGHGYPIALAEAHEAAVVTAADREFFYTSLRQLMPLRGMSQKNAHKRYKFI